MNKPVYLGLSILELSKILMYNIWYNYDYVSLYTYKQMIITKKKSFYLSFLSQTFTNHRTAGEGGRYLFNSSLPLPPASQTLTHQPDNFCKELTSAHNQQWDSNREPLVSEGKLLTTKLHNLKKIQKMLKMHIAGDVERRFVTSNYELECNSIERTLPNGKN